MKGNNQSGVARLPGALLKLEYPEGYSPGVGSLRCWGYAASRSARRKSWKAQQRHSTTFRMVRDLMVTARVWTSAESRIASRAASWLRTLMAKSCMPTEGSLLRLAVLWRSFLERGGLRAWSPDSSRKRGLNGTTAFERLFVWM